MANIRGDIKKSIEIALMELLVEKSEFDISIEVPTDNAHGDFSTNIAMILFKQVVKDKKLKSPIEFAEKIAEILNQNELLKKNIKKIETAKPGFINFFLSKEYLLELLKNPIPSINIGKGKTVIVDYSAPNIAKEFSIGHLRSTIIGQAIYNIYSFLGYKVVGDNHLGDWGTQFGMILAQLSRKNLDIDNISLEELERLYVDFNKEAESQPDLYQLGKEWFKKLEEGDIEARKMWEGAVKISMKKFEEVYKLLNVHIDEALGESFYVKMMPEIVEEAKEKGLAEIDDGALIIRLKDMPPLILLKSDGGSTYHTRDLATIKYRIERWNPGLIIYEVGSEQALHFKQLFLASKSFEWGKKVKLVHVPHGLILFKGKKMSTRRGTNVKLADILDGAIMKVGDIVARDQGDYMSLDVLKEIIGVGAVKYYDLSHKPSSNINFDWEQVLNLEGDSGPYLQYTYSRARSVIKKAKTNKISQNEPFSELQDAELKIVKKIGLFEDVVIRSAEEFSPHYLCHYLYELAQMFNSYYGEYKILGSKEERSRLYLVSVVSNVLKKGLALLGIDTIEKM